MSNAATGADSSAPAREPTVAQVQAVLAVMSMAGQLSPQQWALWEALVRLFPLYATTYGRNPWSLPARQVMRELRELVGHMSQDAALFDAVSAILPDIATALRG